MIKLILLLGIFFFVQADTAEIIDSHKLLLGGWNKIPEADDYIKNLAKWSIKSLTKYINSSDLKIFKIKDIRTQIVAGKNVNFTLELQATYPNKTTKNVSCIISIFDQPWTATRNLKKSVCEELKKVPRGIYIVDKDYKKNVTNTFNISSINDVIPNQKNQNSIAIHTMFFNFLSKFGR